MQIVCEQEVEEAVAYLTNTRNTKSREEAVRMAQQFDSPQTETQLREIQDKLYQHSKGGL